MTEIEELKKEVDAYRNWIKLEGERWGVCTYNILKIVCDDCGCERRNKHVYDGTR